jgi:DNA mismatch repair protein MutH
MKWGDRMEKISKFSTEEELLSFTNNIVGKSFRDVDASGLLKGGSRDKGVLGKIVETGFYGYKLNNDAKADFDNLGIELKVSGYVVNKNGTRSPKERLPLSKINYMEIINEEFEFSKFLFKNKKLLVVWYEYIKGNSYSEFVITDFQLHDLSIDLDIIKNDFYLIKSKVTDGLAHKLSEGDTSYLGAFPKGKNGAVRVKQPNSETGAMPRGFCLKNSYLRGIFRNPILSHKMIFQSDYKTVEEYVLDKIEPYIGFTQKDIWLKLTGRDITDKKIISYQLNKLISNKILGKDEKLKEKHDLFNKTECIIKNLPVDENFYPRERLAFRNLTLSEFESTWEESAWKMYLEEITFLIILYRGQQHGYRKLETVKKITFSQEDINLFGESYEKVRETIKSGDIESLPTPKSFKGQLLVVAPKGVKGSNAYRTFFDRDSTKVCFMLEKDFIHKKIIE